MLSRSSVEQLFDIMVVRYAALWFRMWDGVDIDAIKADWARVLSDVPVEGLLFGVEHLPPERVPTATQFRAICMQAPPPSRPALPPPTPRPKQKARVLAILAKFTDRKPLDRLAWARELKAREDGGEWLTPSARAAYREALATETPESVPINVIPTDVLPPGMRKP